MDACSTLHTCIYLNIRACIHTDIYTCAVHASVRPHHVYSKILAYGHSHANTYTWHVLPCARTHTYAHIQIHQYRIAYKAESSQLDTDKDGKVSLEEFLTAFKKAKKTCSACEESDLQSLDENSRSSAAFEGGRVISRR